MTDVVIFDYAGWVAEYPEFAKVSQPAAQAYFNNATIYCRNDGGGPVCTTSLLSALLNMLTAHIAWMRSPRNAQGQPDSAGTQPPSGISGRISTASEGSVSVSTEFMMSPTPGGEAAWFNQTTYGQAYWAATAQFRTARYMANPTPPFTGAIFPFGRGGWGGWGGWG